MTPDVSVIIVNLNTRDLLRGCLISLRDNPQDVSMEVLVFDNGSTDGSIEMVRTEFPAVRLTLNETNEGFARPNNEGMRESAGRHVLLLNSDTVVQDNAIGKLVRFLDEHPNAGACGPKLVYPDGRLQPSVKGFPTLWSLACDMLFLDKLFPGSALFGRAEAATFPYNETREVDHLMAAVFLVRRDALLQCGLLDERFSIYYNDMDWCYRFRQAGWAIFYVQEARVIHYLGQTTKNVNRNFQFLEEMHDNRLLFYQKRYGRWSVSAAKCLLALGYMLRAVGWTAARAAFRSEAARTMCIFSWRSFAYGARFWTPLPYGRGAEPGRLPLDGGQEAMAPNR